LPLSIDTTARQLLPGGLSPTALSHSGGEQRAAWHGIVDMGVKIGQCSSRRTEIRGNTVSQIVNYRKGTHRVLVGHRRIIIGQYWRSWPALRFEIPTKSNKIRSGVDDILARFLGYGFDLVCKCAFCFHVARC
jgi:hypothetical protein